MVKNSPVGEDKQLETKITDFYGFKEQPFSTSPNPRFLFLTDQHQAIIAKLMYSIAGRQGLSLVIGDIGSGKTTLARHLFDNYRDRTGNVAIFMTNPSYGSAMQLLKAISSEFDIEAKRSRVEQIQEFQSELIKNYTEKKNVILIIDEAQLLIGQHFELIRQFLNFETNEEKLIQIVLFAQTEIRNKLKMKKAVHSRIVTTSHLDSLDFKTLREMINFRCTVAGLKNGSIFTEDAFQKIYELSKGRPRAAIRLCHNALPYGFVNEEKVIGADIIRQVEKRDVYE